MKSHVSKINKLVINRKKRIIIRMTTGPEIDCILRIGGTRKSNYAKVRSRFSICTEEAMNYSKEDWSILIPQLLGTYSSPPLDVLPGEHTAMVVLEEDVLLAPGVLPEMLRATFSCPCAVICSRPDKRKWNVKHLQHFRMLSDFTVSTIVP